MPASPTLDPFWNEPEVKKNWNRAKLSDQEEMHLAKRCTT